tara:strand:- start:261 stop:569 length:309 start_codon:yes stop_codon:yes gene_type:complete
LGRDDEVVGAVPFCQNPRVAREEVWHALKRATTPRAEYNITMKQPTSKQKLVEFLKSIVRAMENKRVLLGIKIADAILDRTVAFFLLTGLIFVVLLFLVQFK